MKRLNPAKLDNMPTLFDFDAMQPAEETPAPVISTPAKPIATAAAKAATPKKKASAKAATDPTVEAEYSAFANKFKDHDNPAELLHSLGFDGFANRNNRYSSVYYTVVRENGTYRFRKIQSSILNRFVPNDPSRYAHVSSMKDNDGSSSTVTLLIAHMASDASVRALEISFSMSCVFRDLDYYALTDDLKAGPVKPVARYTQHLSFHQKPAELTAILKNSKPWALAWLRENGYNEDGIARWAAAPWLETLSKAGYALADKAMRDSLTDAETEKLNRLCQNGSRPKDIFKTQKAVYETLKSNSDIDIWDQYRRMAKTGRLAQDTVAQAYDMGLRLRDLELASHVLGAKHDGRPCFTWESLVNYLRRVDVNEAIPQGEALQLLADYLSMCRQINIAPRLDGDSLKREHDVIARLVRQRRDEEQVRKMKQYEEDVARARAEGASRLGRLEYHEKVYFVRPITDFDDLQDEARQQHNCVASYAGRITSGQCHILTMRETAHPGRSLVTIELAPDLKTVRQKLLAGNHQIRNKSINEFIERWRRQIWDEPAIAAA